LGQIALIMFSRKPPAWTTEMAVHMRATVERSKIMGMQPHMPLEHILGHSENKRTEKLTNWCEPRPGMERDMSPQCDQ
jgi:hypothetical protein